MTTALAAPAFATDDARWQAVLAREPAADGAFVYAVRTTRVYCRPTCAARRPRREHVEFFAAPAEAERTGYRACRRCEPTQASQQQRLVAHVQELLDARDPTPSLTELGALVGFSPFHVQRLFKRATGLTPRQYAAARRAGRLKQHLKAGATVTRALYDAGYGSSRALYASAHEELGMTPASYRDGGAGERIAYAVVDSPLGRMLVAATTRGVCALRFGEDDALLGELAAEFPRAELRADAAAIGPHVARALAYLAGDGERLELPLDVHASAFQQRVWAALRAIPPGETRPYAAIASAIGAPSGARAVARACATNPVALVVPCHRVVRANGDLSGYRWGVERKRALLRQEAARAGAGAATHAGAAEG
jgi:AraC family transcriptional regulator of adaptative response/methylated-DNA-[protein]-cysteine methyltransferase